MDLERMISLHFFTEEVLRWVAATAVVEILEEAGTVVPQNVINEVEAMASNVDQMALTAPDWVVGRA